MKYTKIVRDTINAVILMEYDNFPSKNVYTKTYNCFINVNRLHYVHFLKM